MKEWGFDPTTITVPVSVWFAIRPHGPAHAREWLAKSLPTARKRFFAGDGHVSLVVNHSTNCPRRSRRRMRKASLTIARRRRSNHAHRQPLRPDATFLGVPAADPTYRLNGRRRRGDHWRTFDGDVAPTGCRFGPQAIRVTDYLPHDGMRPSLASGSTR